MVKIALLKARLAGRLINLGLDAPYCQLVSHNTLFLCCCYGDQIVSAKMTSLAKSRKRNFSASEISVLTEKVEENLLVHQSKLAKLWYYKPEKKANMEQNC